MEKPDFKVVKNFDAWMRKMKNQHYSDGKQMTAAYARLTPLKYKEA